MNYLLLVGLAFKGKYFLSFIFSMLTFFLKLAQPLQYRVGQDKNNKLAHKTAIVTQRKNTNAYGS